MNGWKRGFAGRMLIPDHPHTGSGPQDSAGCTRQGVGRGHKASCDLAPRGLEQESWGIITIPRRHVPSGEC